MSRTDHGPCRAGPCWFSEVPGEHKELWGSGIFREIALPLIGLAQPSEGFAIVSRRVRHQRCAV
jgi:hypothetical protein